MGLKPGEFRCLHGNSDLILRPLCPYVATIYISNYSNNPWVRGSRNLKFDDFCLETLKINLQVNFHPASGVACEK